MIYIKCGRRKDTEKQVLPFGMCKYCAPSAITSFAKEQGYSASITSHLFDTWADFKGDIQANRTILLFTEGKNSSGKRWGISQ